MAFQSSPPPRSPTLRAKSPLSSPIKPGNLHLATARLATQQAAIQFAAMSPTMNPSALSPASTISQQTRKQASRPQQALYAKKAPGKIPGISLPRYHPATYTSPSTSSVPSPESNVAHPDGGPLSPRSHAHARGEAQRRLAVYQHEFVAFKQATTPGMRPASPTLNPSMSPCPVTPLALEQETGDYLLAGSGATGAGIPESEKQRLVSQMIDAECSSNDTNKRS